MFCPESRLSAEPDDVVGIIMKDDLTHSKKVPLVSECVTCVALAMAVGAVVDNPAAVAAGNTVMQVVMG